MATLHVDLGQRICDRSDQHNSDTARQTRCLRPVGHSLYARGHLHGARGEPEDAESRLRRATILLGAIAVIAACASPPPPPPPPRPVVRGPPTDTTRIPLTDLLTGTYFGNQGGLYPGGINQPPPDHDSAVKAR